MSFKYEINPERIPEHIAIIMDGNGRWAKAKGLPRTAGHQQGVETVKKITEEATRLGVKYLTLYTFSTEKWKILLVSCITRRMYGMSRTV